MLQRFDCDSCITAVYCSCGRGFVCSYPEAVGCASGEPGDSAADGGVACYSRYPHPLAVFKLFYLIACGVCVFVPAQRYGRGCSFGGFKTADISGQSADIYGSVSAVECTAACSFICSYSETVGRTLGKSRYCTADGRIAR